MTEVEVVAQVGPVAGSDGSTITERLGRQGEQIIQQLHGRLYEANLRGNLYSGGVGLLGVNSALFTTATLGATATPILGVWNPQNSGVNAVVLQAELSLTMTALQATGPSPWSWCTANGQGVPSTGAQALNRSTLVASGGKVRDMSGGAALTGLTGNLTVRSTSALGGGSGLSAAFLATAAGMQTPQFPTIEQIDGAIIVPPGGVLALLSQTQAVAHSAGAAILWEEVPTSG